MKKIFTFATAAMLLGGVMVSCGSEQPKLDPSNPFATAWTAQNGMPPFDKIEISHILPAFMVGIAQEDAEINAITSNSEKANFENTILAFQNTGSLISRVSTAYGALSGTEFNDEIKAIQSEYVKLGSEHSSNTSLNAELFQRIKTVYDDRSNQKYTPEQLRLIERTYDGFARGGANLSVEDKAKMRSINGQLSSIQMEFGNKTRNEVKNFKMVVDNKEDLAGLPETSVIAAAQAAKNAGLDGKWVFTLNKPSYIPFMQYAKNRDLRKVMFDGYSNVGNNNNADDTKENIKQIAKLRLEKANLLGYDNYAQYGLVTTVAKNPESVFKFIEDLWAPVVSKAKSEVKEMQTLMSKDRVKGQIEPWDWFFYAEKVKAAKYKFDENQVKPYFEVNKVRDGAMYTANKLFGLTFKEVKDAVRINVETQVFDVYDKNGKFISVLTWDFFPRESKRGGAWCSRLKQQEYVDGKRVAPIVTITCNFTPPAGDIPALITPDEVSTLFHEFGHALQGMLADIELPGLTGNSRDFVEFHSQILERWAFQPEVLANYAKHYKTGEVIPASLVAKLEKSSTFNQGFMNGENLSASYLDMAYHSIEDVKEIENMDVIKFEEQAMAKLGAIDEFVPRYRSTYFNHVWGGGYAAGYYSYKWSEVMSADGFAAFVEAGDIFDQNVASTLAAVIFSKGSSIDEKVMYESWRGKPADGKHLMKALGLTE